MAPPRRAAAQAAEKTRNLALGILNDNAENEDDRLSSSNMRRERGRPRKSVGPDIQLQLDQLRVESRELNDQDALRRSQMVWDKTGEEWVAFANGGVDNTENGGELGKGKGKGKEPGSSAPAPNGAVQQGRQRRLDESTASQDTVDDTEEESENMIIDIDNLRVPQRSGNLRIRPELLDKNLPAIHAAALRTLPRAVHQQAPHAGITTRRRIVPIALPHWTYENKIPRSFSDVVDHLQKVNIKRENNGEGGQDIAQTHIRPGEVVLNHVGRASQSSPDDSWVGEVRSWRIPEGWEKHLLQQAQKLKESGQLDQNPDPQPSCLGLFEVRRDDIKEHAEKNSDNPEEDLRLLNKVIELQKNLGANPKVQVQVQGRHQDQEKKYPYLIWINGIKDPRQGHEYMYMALHWLEPVRYARGTPTLFDKWTQVPLEHDENTGCSFCLFEGEYGVHDSRYWLPVEASSSYCAACHNSTMTFEEDWKDLKQSHIIDGINGELRENWDKWHHKSERHSVQAPLKAEDKKHKEQASQWIRGWKDILLDTRKSATSAGVGKRKGLETAASNGNLESALSTMQAPRLGQKRKLDDSMGPASSKSMEVRPVRQVVTRDIAMTDFGDELSMPVVQAFQGVDAQSENTLAAPKMGTTMRKKVTSKPPNRNIDPASSPPQQPMNVDPSPPDTPLRNLPSSITSSSNLTSNPIELSNNNLPPPAVQAPPQALSIERSIANSSVIIRNAFGPPPPSLVQPHRINSSKPSSARGTPAPGLQNPGIGPSFCRGNPYRQLDVQKTRICFACREEKYEIIKHRHVDFKCIDNYDQLRNYQKNCMICVSKADVQCKNCPLRVCQSCHVLLGRCKGNLNAVMIVYGKEHLRNDAFLLRSDNYGF